MKAEMDVKIKIGKPINLPHTPLESTVKKSYRKVPIFGLRGGYLTSLEAFIAEALACCTSTARKI
jgi:hypothetical protein